MFLFERHSERNGRASAKAERDSLRLNRTARAGFTLIELLISMMITSLLVVVLAAMMMAMQTAADYLHGHETVHSQATASIERIRRMVEEAGVYQVAGQPARLGLSVVERDFSLFQIPQILVVWSGGRNGGMNGQGVQTRLPRTDELVIYAPDSGNPSQLMEIVSLQNPANIDFDSDNFDDQILAIVDSASSDRVLLCDRLRSCMLSSRMGSGIVGCVRFETFETPTTAELEGITPGSSAWYGLVWSQGIVSAESGLRQTTVTIELQLETRANNTPTTSFTETTLPCYGSASQRYVYRP